MATSMLLGTLPFGVLFQVVLLSWIFKVRKCSCSADWRREYIMYYSLASIPLTLLLFSGMIPHKTFVFAALPIIAAGVVQFYSILTYIPMLKKKCECATAGDWRDDFVYWWVIANLFFTGVMILLSLGVLGYLKAKKA
jgi:hypothetical protein